MTGWSQGPTCRLRHDGGPAVKELVRTDASGISLGNEDGVIVVKNYTHKDPAPVGILTGVYIALAVIYGAVMTYMYLYTTHLHPNERTMALKGRPPISKDEGIAVATLEKERTGRPGTF